MGVALLTQNLLDDLASVFERVHALVSWADPTATIVAMVIVVLGAAAIHMLGLGVVVAGVGIFFFRPPKFRDPLPPKPLAFFDRLPSYLGCSNDISDVNLARKDGADAYKNISVSSETS